MNNATPRRTRPQPASAACARGGSLAICLFFLWICGCERSPDVVIYTSVDQEFARKILEDFQQISGLKVAAVYDTEAGKNTGFLRRIERERSAPRCDVWWSGEVFGSVELARAGLLAAYDSPAAADIPPEWRDSENRWTGLAARARVLAYHRERVRPEELPGTWRALAEPRFARRLALANPGFGTTRGHVAALFAEWGPESAAAYLRDLRTGGATIADGNSHAVSLVASGAADWCMTDTDDVWVAQRRGQPIDLAYPRLADDRPPIWIPCTVGLVAGAPHPDAARRLIDYLVSADVERALAESDSGNVPVRAALRESLPQRGPHPEAINFDAVARQLSAGDAAVADILLR
ncbi:MAG: extracellular solute-binding protein [Phycisphaerales bacterium]|nr:extracellular solute-binding protein [Phycisphaerales bacterium]